MQVFNQKLISYLRCSLCNGKLHLITYQSPVSAKGEHHEYNNNLHLLQCDCGMFYPIIKNIPRMLPESYLDYESEVRRRGLAFDALSQAIQIKYGSIIRQSVERNKRNQKTFSFEWSLLKGHGDVNVWSLSAPVFEKQLWHELDMSESRLADAIVADVGCGHGRSSKILAEKSAIVFSMDVGLSVEEAAMNNDNHQLLFIQADLHHLPFADNFFNLLYSSGVLHHTPGTHNAFKQVAKKVKERGVLCVWLYHPFENVVHKYMLNLRKITTRLPVRLQFWLYLIFLVPIHKGIGWLKGNRKSWREIMINQLDMLSPEYRYEHSHAEVKMWFEESGFEKVVISTTDNYGFSIKGVKG